ncbi:response regulator, partial [Alkalihalophilus pseudofirmus]
MTLDVEMPVMDGLETIQAVRASGYKTKIIMFSTLTTAGAEKTLKAMALGATDFVGKPSGANTTVTPADKIKEL